MGLRELPDPELPELPDELLPDPVLEPESELEVGVRAMTASCTCL